MIKSMATTASVIDSYLGELVAVLLYKLLNQFNAVRSFVGRCIGPTQIPCPAVIEGLVYVHRLKQRVPNLPDVGNKATI